jgi:putative kinase
MNQEHETVTFRLNLAEQYWEVQIAREELDAVHRPLLHYLIAQAGDRQGRYLVLLAGPPGSGKSTLGALWEALAAETGLQKPFVALPMDGFHYPNAVLDARTIKRQGDTVALRRVKGAPESFQLDQITRSIAQLASGAPLAWPRYDRRIHDPAPDAIPVPATGLIVVEGNYLLLDEPGWRELKSRADFSIFVECEEALARRRVLARLQRGGRPAEAAAQHYAFNDGPNWERVMQHRLPSKVVLRAARQNRLEWVSRPDALCKEH